MYNKYGGGAFHYLSVGLSASRCIKEALRSVSRELTVNTILDFPCGHGRVLRFLQATFPNSDITAAEIDSDALKFCRRSFSVNTVLSKKDFNEISIPKQFDLIWCGSLFTHIDEQATSSLLKFFHKHLSEQGVCIFTTHGKHSIELIQSKKQTYGLAEEAQRKVLHEFKATGYGYANYVNREGYGISVVSQQRLIELAEGAGNWNQVLFT